MNGNSFRIDQNTQSLVIGDYTNQPPPSHQGPYYCLARNQFDDSTSDRIYVNVTSAGEVGGTWFAQGHTISLLNEGRLSL